MTDEKPEPVPANAPLPDDAHVDTMVDSSPEAWTYFRNPDGTIDRVRTADIQDALPLGAAKPQEMPEAEEEFYIHLANGEAIKVKGADLPAAAGTNALNGFYEKDGNVYQVIGVYPAETPANK